MRLWLWALRLGPSVALVVALAFFVGARKEEAMLPTPAPRRNIDPVATNAACEECHRDIAAEWHLSEHRSSFTDEAFVRAYAVEPTAFCRGCHAPEDPDAGLAMGPAAEIGVACVTCHLAGDVIVAGPVERGRAAPHPVVRSEDFGASGACSGCHEFTFGDDEKRREPLLMQSTVSEHKQSPHAGESCADCHMPLQATGGEVHRSHAFSSTRDPNAHRSAVQVVATRLDATTVELTLRLERVGHSYPTGDLFRRIRVYAEVTGEDHQVLASKTRYLARHFQQGHGVDDARVRVQVADDRVVPQTASVVHLNLGEQAVGQSISWSVALERVLHLSDRRDEAAVLDDAVEIAHGVL